MKKLFKKIYHSSDLAMKLLFLPKKMYYFYKYRLIPTDIFIKNIYKDMVGKELNLNNPILFTEKIQWLKIYDHNPLYTICADKYKVREYVKDKIGDKYLIPLIYSTNDIKTILFERLPAKYIIKTNHGSGGNILVKNEKMFFGGQWMEFNGDIIKKEICKWIKENYFYKSKEWEYKNIPPRIVIEDLLSDEFGNVMLTDFKIHCFNGKPVYIQTIHDRENDVKETWYDTNWSVIDLNYFSKIQKIISRPPFLLEMLSVAGRLAEEFQYVRVDLYAVNEKVLFGELTFHPYSGLMRFYNEKWDYELGKMLDLQWLIKQI